MRLLREKYDSDYFNAELPFLRQVKARAGIVKSFVKKGNLLEIGCGDGAVLNELKNDFNVFGIDVSCAAIEAANKLVDGSRLRMANIEKAELEGSYDVILAFDVLEHLKAPKKTMQKARNALKSGGFFIFSVPNNYGLFGSLSTNVMNYVDKTHISAFKKEKWLQLAADSGFKLKEIVNKTPFGFAKSWISKHFATTVFMVLMK